MTAKEVGTTSRHVLPLLKPTSTVFFLDTLFMQSYIYYILSGETLTRPPHGTAVRDFFMNRITFLIDGFNVYHSIMSGNKGLVRYLSKKSEIIRKITKRRFVIKYFFVDIDD